MPLIETLTSEQETLLSNCREKWRSRFLSTDRMDRKRAEVALKTAYTLVGKPDPVFLFFDGPQAFQAFQEQQSPLEFVHQSGKTMKFQEHHLAKRLEQKFTPKLRKRIKAELPGLELTKLQFQLYSFAIQPFFSLLNQAKNQVSERVQEQHHEELRRQPGGEFLIDVENTVQQNLTRLWQIIDTNIIQPVTNQSFLQPQMQNQEVWKEFGQGVEWLIHNAYAGGYSNITVRSVQLDFYSSILELSHSDRQYWATLHSVVRSCGFVVLLENLCLVIERPTKIMLDAQEQLHAVDEPALTFADGTEIYAHHGHIVN